LTTTRPCGRGDTERAPSLLAILESYDWHQRAACYDEPDARTFFPEQQNKHDDAASPAMLLPLLFCLRCPVRRQCLEEGLKPVRLGTAPENAPLRPQSSGNGAACRRPLKPP
jgi:hypothetical protein